MRFKFAYVRVWDSDTVLEGMLMLDADNEVAYDSRNSVSRTLLSIGHFMTLYKRIVSCGVIRC